MLELGIPTLHQLLQGEPAPLTLAELRRWQAFFPIRNRLMERATSGEPGTATDRDLAARVQARAEASAQARRW